MQRNKIRHCGQSIIETVLGIIVIVMVVYFLCDLIVVIQVYSINGDLAARAARAAANQADAASAQKVADEVKAQFNTSSKIAEIKSLTVHWGEPVSTQLIVDSIANVNLPLPILFVSSGQIELHGQSVVPILGGTQ